MPTCSQRLLRACAGPEHLLHRRRCQSPRPSEHRCTLFSQRSAVFVWLRQKGVVLSLPKHRQWALFGEGRPGPGVPSPSQLCAHLGLKKLAGVRVQFGHCGNRVLKRGVLDNTGTANATKPE